MDLQILEDLLVAALSLIATYFACLVYGIYRHKNSAIGWLAIAVSMAIISFHHLVSSYSDMFPSSQVAQLFNSFEWVVLLAISLVQIYAFWKVKSIYDEQARVEEETMARIRKFEASRARRGLAKARAKPEYKKGR